MDDDVGKKAVSKRLASLQAAASRLELSRHDALSSNCDCILAVEVLHYWLSIFAYQLVGAIYQLLGGGEAALARRHLENP